MTEITQELQERMQRWKQIELLVNCPIMNNPGLSYLETILRGIGRGTSYAGKRMVVLEFPSQQGKSFHSQCRLLIVGSVISNSQDDMDDDGASSIYCPSAGK